MLATRKMWASTRGKGAVVAIIDTGVDYRHPDLAPNMIGGISMVSGVKDYMDDNGHGTHVAGTIGANGKLLGVAPECKMLAIKVLNADGSGAIGDINRGLAWARNWRGPGGEQVDVINMSLGGPLPNPTLHAEIIKTVGQGITVICAAGNAGDGNPNTDEVSYPAYYPETVAVGAIDLSTGIANFSNSNSSINVVAPGVDTYSTYPENRYINLSGTSMAAPHISGAAALIYSRWKQRFGSNPDAQTVRNILDYQAIDLGAAGFDHLYGYGFFSFDPAGGKAIRIKVGERRYLVNNKEVFFVEAPFSQGKLVCADIMEICNLLCTDNRWAEETDGKGTGILEIWS
ncbi:MAG TPA: serine protease [Syntrophomonas sp.]|nr:serine protease [Syntrophomonas sp.]